MLLIMYTPTDFVILHKDLFQINSYMFQSCRLYMLKETSLGRDASWPSFFFYRQHDEKPDFFARPHACWTMVANLKILIYS